ncbi:MAG: type IV pilus assembly protein PilX [Burkholderiaceae bacterium]|jgi:type IV pilus assembly protein PilX
MKMPRRYLQPVRGIALVSAMLILVMLTLLALSMFRGFGLQQKIAGNVLEKSRAFEAAQSALQYGEFWLAENTTALTGVPCASTITILSDADMRVCDTALGTPTDLASWVGGSTYTPLGMQVKPGGGAIVNSNNNADINYATSPALHIAYLGLGPNGTDALYAVTGVGYGGSNTSAAVVQSVVRQTARVTSLTGL